jgi:hypothetical protein
VPLAAYARLGLGRVCYERNQLQPARDHLAEACEHGFLVERSEA